jgi:hypothetical protein
VLWLFYFTFVSSVSVQIRGFAAEDVPAVDVVSRSLKPFYPAIDKLHRPALYIRNFAVCCLVYARSLILIFGIFTVGFCYLRQPSSTSNVCVIISNYVSSVCLVSSTIPCKHQHTSPYNRLRRHKFIASQGQYHNLLQSNCMLLTASWSEPRTKAERLPSAGAPFLVLNESAYQLPMT